MPRCKRILLLLAGVVGLFSLGVSQSVIVNSITISGMKRTRPAIVFRELTFAKGDTLLQMDLGPTMERNQNNLLNLGIFNEVIVNVSEWDTERHLIDVTIELTESWYIYAVPILELADRNFNVWWTTYNHDLDRLNLGARLDMLNFSGRNDKFKAKFQFGYTPKQEIEYRFPYFNRRQSLGLTIGGLHSINKEISYATINNEEQFIQLDERKLLERWKGEVNTFYRPNLFLKYELSLAWQSYQVDEEVVADYNETYFRHGGTEHNVLISRFAAEYDDRDLKIYPAQGIKAQIELEKSGLGPKDDENSFLSNAGVEINFVSGRRFQHRFSVQGQYSFSRMQPSYLYYHGLGYGQNFIRGYELYVVDGLDVAIGKYQLAYKLFEKKINWGRRMPVPQFKEMPLHVYLSVFAETGYVQDPFTGFRNPLANQWLYGGGPGLDIVLYNNFLFQFNVSTNHLHEWGFFIHNKTSF